MAFNLTESPWIRAGRQYSVRVRLSLFSTHRYIDIENMQQDLWTHTSNGTAVRNFTAHAVPAHGVVALLLRDAGDEPEGAGGAWPCARWHEGCIDRNGTVVDG
jgi:alpha-galactosidase